MNKRQLISAFMTTVLVTACNPANSINPIVDRQQDTFDAAKYDTDLRECREYANSRSVESEAAVGAVAGALLGFALGATAGGSNLGKKTMWTGALAGGVGGAGNAALSTQQILTNCLAGRGYSVLGTGYGG